MRHGAGVDAAFTALADPARRAVVERLRAGPARAGELARALAVSAPRMSQHLRVLRRSGLVEETGIDDDARVRFYRLRREPFAALRSWSEEIEAFWEEELGAFKRYAERRVRRRG
ncbi:MAG: HTH-type transcriptional regulator [Steroidobacteraceae bacterium]|nr:HTH-type transcriptional regulator [Steroidobacteraceae bacterium]